MTLNVKINESWRPYLEGEFEKDYFKNLVEFVKKEYKERKIYPPPKDIFRAFQLCKFEDVKVVILGQDPYHGALQANGLAFAVGEKVTNVKVGEWILPSRNSRPLVIPLIYKGGEGLNHVQIHISEVMGIVDPLFAATLLAQNQSETKETIN